jgi:hypothetical protein
LGWVGLGLSIGTTRRRLVFYLGFEGRALHNEMQRRGGPLL